MADEHAQGGQAAANFIPDVKHVIAVSSGKGGVGKSTVASNLACALALAGAKVGLLDADLYGPNIPMMMGSDKGPEQQDGKIVPVENYGVKLISMAFLVPEEAPLVWRGPMVHQYLQAFFRDVLWGDLDYLLIDLPPGTGDVQLSLSQMVPLAGAITVTTPQEVALYDVRKGMAMFQKVNVPLLGIIENMSFFVCGHCGERTDIFSHGGGERAAEKLGIPFLGRIPIDPAIRDGGDSGHPIVVADPASPQAEAFREIAKKIMGEVGGADKSGSSIDSLLKKIKQPFATN
ncbi:MAG: Mrp/NBP35 family ATP-binding protein [Nitrospira sp.]|nr:Mrp/NBP35 family ATP-binding protein [Nitrospira sp.]MDH4237771.1 Mrp/NBP35 family ATP-binding protein [Nitrospira sp.]MDH4328728.1 Mrp/NBP35 family ATP-binding protein [Nitrospira sp.]MDH5254124.1 Mrp/NBP35 family ATP-binding protein [Nitrospira sp.]MDH5625471.1 Mrp/NBP35 family ATP-binding protein [Nitrospira sp.]